MEEHHPLAESSQKDQSVGKSRLTTGLFISLIAIILTLVFGLIQVKDAAADSKIQADQLTTQEQIIRQMEQSIELQKEALKIKDESIQNLKKINQKLRVAEQKAKKDQEETIREFERTNHQIAQGKKKAETDINKAENRIQIELQKDRERNWRKRMKNKKTLNDFNPLEEGYKRVRLHNASNNTIRVAIMYMDLDKKWVIEGWTYLKPNQIKDSKAIASKGTFYFYGESTTSKGKWDGSKKRKELVSNQYVVDEHFVKLPGYELYGNHKKMVSFYRSEKSINSGWLLMKFSQK